MRKELPGFHGVWGDFSGYCLLMAFGQAAMNFLRISRTMSEDWLRAPSGAGFGGAGAGDPAVPDPGSPEIPTCNGE